MNKHIESFLNYYYGFEYEPGYAVLLKGKWGAGKTWFTKQTLERYEKSGGRYLYISLYGITTFEQIEEEFFKQLHPVLSSKGMVLTGKILKGFLRASLKVDLDGHASVTAQLPELNLPEYLTDTSGFVIVFDDLERASIELDSLLGYINHYVEHGGYKVIVIANEEEILERQKNNNKLALNYMRIKEKLIGKTFEVVSDWDGAVSEFIRSVKDNDIRDLYERNVSLISRIYIDSEYNNLRHLKQALWDFERFSKELNQSVRSKKDLLLELLKVFLALSFELRSGSILPKDIFSFNNLAFFISDDESSDESDDPFQRIKNKYISVDFESMLLENSVWVEFFDKGICSAEKIQESLDKTEYFYTEKTPDWVFLWHFMELEDSKFDELVVSVKNSLYKKEFNEVGEVKHVFGILMYLSKTKILDIEIDDIFEHAIAHVDCLKNRGVLRACLKNHSTHIYDSDSWGGLGFYENNTAEFRRLNDYIESASEAFEVERYPEVGLELLKLVDLEPELFYRKLTVSSSAEDSYYKVPILSYIDPAEFVSAFLSVAPKSKRTICYAIMERYENHNYNKFLLSELEWLESVISELRKAAQLRAGKISGHQIDSYLARYFMKALAILNKIESQSVVS